MKKYVTWSPAKGRKPIEQLPKDLLKHIGKHGYLETSGDILYDYVDNHDDVEMKMFNNLGFVEGDQIWLPKGTKLKYLETVGDWALFEVNDSGYSIDYRLMDLADFLAEGDFKLVNED